MSLGDIIKKYRSENDLSMSEFSKKSGISKAYIALLEKNKHPKTGKPIIPSITIIKQASDAMGMDFNKLFEMIDGSVQINTDNVPDAFRTDIPIGHYRIPVLTTVAAGKPIYAEEDVLEWIDYDKEPGDHVRACRIEGNSMIPRIQNGDTVIFDSELGWEDGDVVIATVNGDHATCKRIKRYADGIALLSDNANIAPMYFSKKEVEELPVKVIGRVTEVRGKL